MTDGLDDVIELNVGGDVARGQRMTVLAPFSLATRR